MTQNKIAPITTIIRIPITSVSTATSFIVAAMSASLPSAPSVEEPKNDQKREGADGGAGNGRRDPGAGVDASLGTGQLPIKASMIPMQMSATRSQPVPRIIWPTSQPAIRPATKPASTK
jgi:hypothetical protein